MGTRSTIKFIRKENDGKLVPLVGIYQQFDGYISGVGYDLAKWLKSKRLINGISSGQNTSEYANGFECLIAQFIRDFKEEVGGFYITDFEDIEEYNYQVIFDSEKFYDTVYDNANGLSTDDVITIKVDNIFEGTPSELLKFKEEDEC